MEKIGSDATLHTLRTLAPKPSLNSIGGCGFHLQLTNTSDDDVLVTSLLVGRRPWGHVHVFAQRPRRKRIRALRARAGGEDRRDITAGVDAASAEDVAANGVTADGTAAHSGCESGTGGESGGAKSSVGESSRTDARASRTAGCALPYRCRALRRSSVDTQWVPGSFQEGVRRWVTLGDAALPSAWHAPVALPLQLQLPIPAHSSRRIYVRADNERMGSERDGGGGNDGGERRQQSEGQASRSRWRQCFPLIGQVNGSAWISH